MSRQPSPLAAALARWLMVWLAAYALLLPALHAFRAGEEALYGLALTGGFSLFAAVWGAFSKWRRLAVTAAGAAAVAVWAASGGGRAMLSLFLSLFGAAPAETALAFHSEAAVLLAALVLTLFAKLLTVSEPVVSAPLLLLSALALWFAGAREPVSLYLPTAAALALMLAFTLDAAALPRADTAAPRRFRRALPVALALALFALLLTPGQRTVVPELEKQADRLRQYINDRFFFSGSREMFSLRLEGYQPMGERGLGGKPSVADTPVMEVTAEGKVYLRGTILNLYTGRMWYDTLSSERYGYHSFRYAALRDSLMDARLPEGGGSEKREVSIRLLRESPSTLFTPQRVRTLSLGEGMVPWFNAASELFITRNLKPGDRYSVVYEAYVADTAETDALAAALSNIRPGAGDRRYDSLLPAYTQLPGHLQPDGIIADLARRIVGGEGDPYRQALAVMNYLKRNYAYSVDVPDAPNNMDFAAHFLFELKRGYCTYFATAMTVLSRSLGLPARYVEGFVAAGGEGGAPLTVTSMQAHAWTEVYVAGLGWVTFDATGSDGDEAPEDGPEGPPPSAPPPSPSPAPPEEDESPETGYTPTPPPGGAPPEITPEPSPLPTRIPPPADPEGPAERGAAFPWWTLLAVAALLFAVWCVRREAPDRRAARQTSPTARFMVYWQALCLALEAGGRATLPSETLRDYALRIEQEDGPLARLADEAGAALYGRQNLTREAAAEARRAFLQEYAALAPVKKLRLIWLRTTRGLGRDLKILADGLARKLPAPRTRRGTRKR